MSEGPTRRVAWLLIALCAALAVASLFLHPEAGPDSLPLKYPLLGAGVTAAAILIVRLLRPLLRLRSGEDRAD